MPAPCSTYRSNWGNGKMADNDYNTVRPVESLHNVTGLTPTQRRQERKRRQNPFAEQSNDDQEPREQAGQQPQANNADEDKDGEHIDYCA